MHRIVLLLALAACGSATPKSGAPLPPWKDMNADQRLEFMKSTVLPAAKQKFQAFDAKKFAKFDCRTCHGKGAEDGSFEMPNPDIKALPPTAEAYEAWIAKDANAKRYTDFMSNEVVPMMSQLLQIKAFDPATHTGEFSCPACHTMAGEKK
ncbi:MAG TPA: hypothetical protein VL326_25400 [Kofleriaceae bacterium]|nr:hypothetical protein [Kofleriaceae bacterium]